MPQTKADKAAYNARWYAANRDRERIKMKARREYIKDCVFEAYGGYRCVCCGELERGFLSIDHIHNNGAAHRREIGNRGGVGLYYWLAEHDFPPGFQILCYNCNLGKARNGGICPHQTKGKYMAKMKANPLGNLMMELVHDQSTITGGSMSGDDVFRDQVPVKEGLAGQDTFKADASKPSSRAEVEKRRMYIDSGMDLKGANMGKEYGSKDTQSKDFSNDASA